jgi:hypothetical protein
MRKATRYASTSAVPAIAAVLALISTPALAQEVPAQPPPTTTEPAPVTVDAPPAPETAAPPLEDTTQIAPAELAAPEKAAPAPKPKTPAKAAPKPVSRTVTHAAHASAPAAPAKPVAPQATTTSAVKPIVDTRAAAPPPAPATKPARGMDNDTAMELGGGALALLALGAGAFALARRRRHEDGFVEDDIYELEPAAEVEPAPMAEATPHRVPTLEDQPTIVAPPASAFAWGNSPRPATNADDDRSDRRPGETWVERAYRGPSPANPSVSLKNRLRRAAFFDKRERDVEAGKAEPVDTDAGLPDAMVEDRERELA